MTTAASSPGSNLRIKLVQRPIGRVKTSDFLEEAVPLPEVHNGEFLCKLIFISVDPAMRGWMSADTKSYIEPVNLGDIMRAGGIAQVIQSKNEKFPVGNFVTGLMGLQKYVVSDGAGLKSLQLPSDSKVPLSAFMGPLGMTGLTAYFGLLRVGEPKSGETLLVSGAAGSTGSMVGQIGKIHGCRVVGIAGSDEKCEWLTKELGFDAAINYKTTKDLTAELARVCPEGVDVYFDNVGGPTLESTLSVMNKFGRIAMCGAISQYNSTSPYGVRNTFAAVKRSLRMQGFVVFNYANEYRSALEDLMTWVSQGKLKWRESRVQGFGLQEYLEALDRLFDGKNIGKVMLEVSQPQQ